MGMFDYLKCKYPLPVAGCVDKEFQTKDTPSQYMDLYMIREDGTLWQNTKYGNVAAHPEDEHPDPVTDFTGEVRFYSSWEPRRDGKGGGWIEFSAYFTNGKLDVLNLIENTPPSA